MADPASEFPSVDSARYSEAAPSGALGVLRSLIRRFGAAAITLAITGGSVVISMALVAIFDQVMKGHVPFVDLIAAAIVPAILGPIATYGFVRLSQDLDRAEEQVRALATRDPLTGVLNHRHFMESARTELARLARHERVATLLFMDVDCFKDVNDQLGHAAGDRALVEIAAACQTLLRRSDLLGRCGGDDFLMLLSEINDDAAMIVAERIRSTIETLTFETPLGELRPTVSIGLSSCGAEVCSFEHLYQRADRNLYLAKQKGRNQVVS